MSSTDTTTTTPFGEDFLKVFSTSTLLIKLWRRAGQNVTGEDLDWIADGALEHVTQIAGSMSATLSGTALLVTEDTRATAGPYIGSLQSGEEVGALLNAVASHLDLIAGVAQVGAEAASLRHDRATLLKMSQPPSRSPAKR